MARLYNISILNDKIDDRSNSTYVFKFFLSNITLKLYKNVQNFIITPQVWTYIYIVNQKKSQNLAIDYTELWKNRQNSMHKSTFPPHKSFFQYVLEKYTCKKWFQCCVQNDLF